MQQHSDAASDASELPSHDAPIGMGDAIGLHAVSNPERTAVICGDDSITYAELDRRSSAAARLFLDRGVTAASTVAIALPNSLDLFVAAFATWKAGATPFPLSARLPAGEQEALLGLARPAIVVAPESHPNWPSVTPEDLALAQAGEKVLPSPPCEQPWKIIGSGGSTGRPKLVVAARSALVDPTASQYTIEPGDVVFAPGPLYHQGPFIFTMSGLFLGNTVVTMTRFDPSQALAALAKHRVTWTFLVPTMTHRIWRLPEQERHGADLSHLRLLFSTGAPWAPWLKRKWLDWLGPDRVYEWYGGAEEQGGVNITGTEALAHPGSIGQAHEGVRVVDEAGADLPAGEVGELVFRERPGQSHRYIGEVQVPRDDWRTGWGSYGDLAWIGEDGYVYLADRRTDMVVSGGVNVYPAEIEQALESHPLTCSAVVIGLPDDDLGQRVHAIVQVDPESEAISDEVLHHYLRERLSGAKRPRTYEFVHHDLRDDAGKVRRSALRSARLSAGAPLQFARPALDVALVVDDLERSLRFYRDTLGLAVRAEFDVPRVGRMATLPIGQSTLKLVRLRDGTDSPTQRGGLGARAGGFRYCTIPVLDLDAAMGRCSVRGYAAAMRPRQATETIRVGAVEDPDGNWIEFLEDSGLAEQPDVDKENP